MEVIEIAGMGAALGAAFGIINKLIDALTRKLNGRKENGAMTTISQRLMEVVLAQQRTADMQSRMVEELANMERRFESGMSGMATRICDKIDAQTAVMERDRRS